MTAKQNSSEIVMLITSHAEQHAELSNFSFMLRKEPLIKSKNKQFNKFYILVSISRKTKQTEQNKTPTTNKDRQSCRTMKKLNFQCVLRNILPK